MRKWYYWVITVLYGDFLLTYTWIKFNYCFYSIITEPDCYVEDHRTHVSPQQGANGFRILRDLLIKKHYPVQLLAGPDVAVLTRLNYFSEWVTCTSEFLLYFEAWAKLAPQWLVCVPLGIYLEPIIINKQLMLLVTI